MACLRFNSGPRQGETVVLDQEKMVFGRHQSCDFVLMHPTVSRRHFTIERTAGKYFIVDGESNNGTFVNNERVSWLELKDGDTIRVGPFEMVAVLVTGKETASLNQDTRIDKTTITAWSDLKVGGTPGFGLQHSQIYPREYIEGITHFNARRYFEAHESWEEIWLRSSGEAKIFYQMLIQAAVGLHHYEKANFRGARGMYKNVAEKLTQLSNTFMSLDVADFAQQFKQFFVEMIENESEEVASAELARPVIILLSIDSND
jgi:pSer/pThr/pTyr-binding forkhead associated (FHA) protein